MAKFKILVVGDIMVDHYKRVTSKRKAQEASVPVWDEIGEEIRLGGAANVAANLASIAGDEAQVHLAGICSLWKATQMMDKFGIKHERVMGSHTMTKLRYVEDDKIVARVDNFLKFDDEEVNFFEMLMDYWNEDFDAIVMSDYDKGTLSDDIIAGFKSCTKLLVVDSKRADLRPFHGADVLKVNELEYGAQVASRLYHNFAEMFPYVVVTKGSKGADLITSDPARSAMARIDGGFVGATYTNHIEHFPSFQVHAKDVTGCGDTHTAAMTFGYLKTRDIRSAVKFANNCAAQVVQKFGTSVAVV